MILDGQMASRYSVFSVGSGQERLSATVDQPFSYPFPDVAVPPLPLTSDTRSLSRRPWRIEPEAENSADLHSSWIAKARFELIFGHDWSTLAG